MNRKANAKYISKTSYDYRNICANIGICELYNMEVPNQDKDLFDKLKSLSFDMNKPEALEVFYQILRRNGSQLLDLWNKTFCWIFPWNLNSCQLFNFVDNLQSVSFEQAGVLSAYFFIAILEEIIIQSEELSAQFSNVPEKLLEAINNMNTPSQILRDYHAPIESLSGKAFLQERILKHFSPNSFLVLDYNLHQTSGRLGKFDIPLKRDEMLNLTRFRPSYYLDYILEAALAQKAYEDRDLNLGIPSYIHRIDINDAEFVVAAGKFILVPLKANVYYESNIGHEVLAEKRLLESARAEVYNNVASKVTTAESLFKYLIEDPFLGKLDQLDTLNDAYPLNAEAFAFSLISTSDLTGTDLERVGINSFVSFMGYLHFMALKHAKMIITDPAHRWYLLRTFTRGKLSFYEEDERPKCLKKPFPMPPLQLAHQTILQLARMGDENKMTDEDRKIYEREYKPLADNPKAYQKLLDGNVEKIRVILKDLFRFSMEELAYKFLFPPTLRIGEIDTVIINQYTRAEDP